MKKIILLSFLSLFSLPLWADISFEPLLNKVTLRLHTEQWVTTKTALVQVTIQAAVADQGIDRVQEHVMQNLRQFSPAEWHIVSYDRKLDKSGLEAIQITAEARLAQSELGNLRDKAKTISKPGETYSIENVEFVPSQDEIREANVALRSNMYQQVKTEIETLNKSYPDQKFYVHSIDFISLPIMPMPMANNMMFQAKMSAGAMSPVPLSVGNRQELQATVVIASNSNLVAQKMTAIPSP